MIRMIGKAAFGLAAFALLAAATEADKAQFRRPDTIPFPAESPYDPQIAILGKMLFFDPRLSGAQNMSCATCHNPSFGWETPVARAIGAANEPLGRHAPTAINVAWGGPFFWDGRAATLEAQASGPITADKEMNAPFDQVIARLSQVPEYKSWFDRLFPGEGITEASITRAIATFERTIVSGRAPFDRWLAGDETAISAQAIQGFDLFVGKANCVACHSGWTMTDNGFDDIGLPDDDLGLGAITGAAEDHHKFESPSLRNIALRAPYMHDGSLDDLQAVIDHYNGGGVPRETLSPDIRPLGLSEDEQSALKAFLMTLTEDQSRIGTPQLPTN
jgi:cytochrome c peroxidase